mgnify:FL=1
MDDNQERQYGKPNLPVIILASLIGSALGMYLSRFDHVPILSPLANAVIRLLQTLGWL